MTIRDLMQKCYELEASIEVYYDPNKSTYGLSISKTGTMAGAVTLYFPKDKFRDLNEADLGLLIEILLDTVKINNTPANLFNY